MLCATHARPTRPRRPISHTSGAIPSTTNSREEGDILQKGTEEEKERGRVVDKYKARLFKRGNQYSESWADTFAPVVDFMIFRLLLSISAQKDWHVQQINLSNAVMQNKMMREVWMQSPKLFDCVAAFQVCLLRKSLYRLRDAPRVRVSSGCVAEVGIKAHAVRALRNRDIVC